jgi:hypothetical protein
VASYFPKISVIADVTPGLSSPDILIKIISLFGIKLVTVLLDEILRSNVAALSYF